NGDGRDFRGQDRKNDTHASTTDLDARLYRKSNNAEARLAYLGHVLMENRHGLVVDAQATVADGFAERTRLDEKIIVFNRLLGKVNDAGLFSEDIDPAV